MSTLRNGDKSSQAGAEDKKLVGMELQDMRSDEGLLDEKARRRKGMRWQVDLGILARGNAASNAWLMLAFPHCQIGMFAEGTLWAFCPSGVE